MTESALLGFTSIMTFGMLGMMLTPNNRIRTDIHLVIRVSFLILFGVIAAWLADPLGAIRIFYISLAGCICWLGAHWTSYWIRLRCAPHKAKKALTKLRQATDGND